MIAMAWCKTVVTPVRLQWSYYSLAIWWRHQMETISALMAICAGNSPVHGEFSAQRPMTRSFDVFFDLRLNKRLSKQSRGWWFETLSRPLWRHRNDKPSIWCFLLAIIIGITYLKQATGLDAYASRVKCPARYVSHLHEIFIYIYELFIAFVCFVVCSLL